MLKKIDASTKITYVIELKYGYYHLHFKTTFTKLNQLKRIIKNDDLTSYENDMNTYIIKVWDEVGLKWYFRKQNKPVLLK
jgi:hypothetical protein